MCFQQAGYTVEDGVKVYDCTCSDFTRARTCLHKVLLEQRENYFTSLQLTPGDGEVIPIQNRERLLVAYVVRDQVVRVRMLRGRPVFTCGGGHIDCDHLQGARRYHFRHNPAIVNAVDEEEELIHQYNKAINSK